MPHSRRMTAAEVSAKLGIHKSSAHEHLSRLADAGLLTRHADDIRAVAALLVLAVVCVGWRASEWRNPDGDGTWGVDEPFPRVRAGLVILAMAIALLAPRRERGHPDHRVPGPAGHESERPPQTGRHAARALPGERGWKRSRRCETSSRGSRSSTATPSGAPQRHRRARAGIWLPSKISDGDKEEDEDDDLASAR